MAAKENRNIKDSVFVDLFYSDRDAEKNIRDLYHALHPDDQITEETIIEKIKIDDVMYMNFKNDVSFEVNNRVIVFGEHQSTINYNMPLRSLLYAGRAYEQIIDTKNRYRQKLIKLPKPEFYTFYYGNEDTDVESELKLSDAFYDLGEKERPALELTVKMINITTKAGNDILNRCHILHQYSLFMDIVKKYREMDVPDALKLAIQECKEKGILKDYLERKGSEVVNMLTAQYDYETDIAVKCEEAKEQIEKQDNLLMYKLITAKRYDDIKRAATDKAYKKLLMKELKIID